MPIPRPRRHPGWWLALACSLLLTARSARAQQQERSLQDRIQRPDMGLTAQGFDKAFTPGASGVNKSFSGHLFGFGRSASLRGDGKFQTHAFDSKTYQTNGYATRKSPLTDHADAQGDRKFDTKAVPVQEDRAANKKAESSPFYSSDKPFISHGKRQDEFDDLHRKKHLSIDEVRELLNRNK